MPEISIIVPVYNVEKYLTRCIDSILNQTFTDFELILVDDGSTDKSGVICDKYSKIDSRIKVIHSKNEGAAQARNYGLDIAKGKFIGFVDSDDYINRDMYQILYENINKYNCDICVCGHQSFQDKVKVSFEDSKEEIIEFDNKLALKNYFLDYEDNERVMYTIMWDKLYRRELFKNLRFPKGKICEDGYVIYKLLYNSKKIIYINKILYYYLQRSDSISKTKFSLKTLEVYDDWKEIYHFFYEENIYLSSLAAKFYINKHIRTYNQILESNLNSMEYEKYKKIIKEDLKKDLIKFFKSKVRARYLFRCIAFLINYRLVRYLDKIINLVEFLKYKADIFMKRVEVN